jgi:predicted membrane chloride channel (bestrophin family)
MIWNIFKNVFLGLFGVAVIAMGLTITSHFDKGLKEDNFLFAYISITWTVYIVCKAYSEYDRYRKLN